MIIRIGLSNGGSYDLPNSRRKEYGAGQNEKLTATALITGNMNGDITKTIVILKEPWSKSKNLSRNNIINYVLRNQK